jgi:hypothetical protein
VSAAGPAAFAAYANDDAQTSAHVAIERISTDFGSDTRSPSRTQPV